MYCIILLSLDFSTPEPFSVYQFMTKIRLAEYFIEIFTNLFCLKDVFHIILQHS